MTYKIPKYITNEIIRIEKQRNSLRDNIEINIAAYIDIDNTSMDATARKLKGPMDFDKLCQLIQLDPVSLVKLKVKQQLIITTNHWTLDEFQNQRLVIRVEFFRKQLANLQYQENQLSEQLYNTVKYQIK